MKVQVRFLIFGFVGAVILFAGIIVCLFYLAGGETRPVFRDQILPHGKTVKVTSFYLVWGVDHDPKDRDLSKDDGFAKSNLSPTP
jgi:hypothetical protein